MKIIHVFLFLFLLNSHELFCKCLVFTTAFNRPDFIELQHNLFRKFLQDDYEFVVVSDANSNKMKMKIQTKCDELGIRCISVPQEIHQQPYLPRAALEEYTRANSRHCNAAQWAWDNYFSKHEGPVMIIDSDMFLIRPFSIEKTLGNHHLAGVMWKTNDMITGQEYSYLWLALILFNNPILPERDTILFNCGWLGRPNTKVSMDSGGWTYFYLEKYRDLLRIHEIPWVQGHNFYCPYRYEPEGERATHLSSEEIAADLRSRGFSENEISLVLEKPYTIELLGDNHILHYRAGTNYENYPDAFLSAKDRILGRFFNKLLRE
jgi:hypothetical protein